MSHDNQFDQRIRERAYFLWLEEGRPNGRHDDHWQRAERELRGSQVPHPGGENLKPEDKIGEVMFAAVREIGQGS